QDVGFQIRLPGFGLGVAGNALVGNDPHHWALADHGAFHVDDLHPNASLGSRLEAGIASLIARAVSIAAMRSSSIRLGSVPARKGMLSAATTLPLRSQTGAAKAWMLGAFS